jgi:phage FluMu gp28-like protein
MPFSSLFRRPQPQSNLPATGISLPHPPAPGGISLPNTPPPAQPNPTQSHLIPPNPTENVFPFETWCLPTQLAWLNDPHPLRIWEKSRQVGATKTDALDSVLKASPAGARYDVWVSSRDEFSASLYLDDCRAWAKLLHLAATYKGRVLLDRKSNSSGYVLQFANRRSIYCLSSNPNVFAGKRGHVKLDEFALHPDQRLLYQVAKPVTTWGGTLSIISTHRGPATLFNQIILSIRQNPHASPWHLFSYPLQKAIAEGIVERINNKKHEHKTREQFENDIRRECLDETSWKREYCCIPSDESTAFISHDMLAACEDTLLRLLTTEELIAWLKSPAAPQCAQLYLGMDVGRKTDLTVIDVGLKDGDLMYDKLRIELHNTPFPVQREHLYQLLELPQLRRACIDETGNGSQLAEEAKIKFGSKVEPVHITAPVKEKLAFGLRQAFESRTLRIPYDPALHADLHAMNKIVTAANNIRLDGDSLDSHCDRFWAKALRQEAARTREEYWAMVG